MSHQLFRPEKRKARQQERDPDTTRILVVEDDPIFQGLLTGWFGEGEADIEMHGNLADAVEAIRFGRFDLVLLDLNLPDSRGMETVEAVLEHIARTPVVVLTSEEDEGLGLEAVRQGAQDFLKKDEVGPDALRRQVGFAIERRRLEEFRRTALANELELKRLRELDHAKSNFYQAAARGLRDPLKPLRMGIQMVRLEVTGRQNNEFNESLTGVERHLDELERLVGDLVDFSAIQTESLDLERRSVDIPRVLRETTKRWEQPAQNNRLALHCDCPPDLVVEADPRRLRQVLDHLMENALKSTPGGGRIDVEADREGDVVEIRVQDSGIGVDPERIPELFEAFGNSADGEGARGLGLAFSRGVIESHGGTLTLESKGEGEGVTATIRLPLAGSPDA